MSVKRHEDVSRYLISGDIGLQGSFDYWRIGLVIQHFAQTQWLGSTHERQPVIFRLGGGYYFTNKSAITGEAYKSSDAGMDFRFGLNYQPASILDLRIGLSTLRPSFCFGLGLLVKDIQINIAASWHQQLGLSPVTDVVYAW